MIDVYQIERDFGCEVVTPGRALGSHFVGGVGGGEAGGRGQKLVFQNIVKWHNLFQKYYTSTFSS